MISTMVYCSIAAAILGNHIRRKRRLTYKCGIVCRLIIGLILLVIFHPEGL